MTDRIPTPKEVTAEEFESLIKKQLRYPDLSPEEFVACESHRFIGFSFHRMNFPDQAFRSWLSAIVEIMRDPVRARAAREKYFTPQEVDEIERTIRSNEESFEQALTDLGFVDTSHAADEQD